MSFIFKKTLDVNNKFSITNVEMEVTDNDMTIDGLCEQFKYFLQACSFVVDGEIIYCQEKKDET